jgi:hypothetical protein
MRTDDLSSLFVLVFGVFSTTLNFLDQRSVTALYTGDRRLIRFFFSDADAAFMMAIRLQKLC